MNRLLLWSVLSLCLGLLSRAIAEDKAPSPDTVRDRMWTWCVDASYDWPAHEAGELPAKNRMTPVESAVYLGVPNVMFIQYNGIPAAPFDQYYTPFKSFQQVFWTLSNNGNQVHTLGPEQEHVYRLAAANSNITGLLLDDFLIGPFPDESQSQRLGANSPKFPVTVEIQLPQTTLADSVLLTQSDWAAGGYRTAKFAIDATSNGTVWKEIATGELPDEGGASRSVKFAEQSLHSFRIRVLTSHDEEAPHGCGLHAVNLLRHDEPYLMETATITTDSEYPGHEASRLSRLIVDQTPAPKRFDSQVSPADLAKARQRMQAIGGRKLDLAVVVYTNQIDPGIIPILKNVDVVLLWTWKSSDLKNLEANFKRLKEILPEKQIVLGCYLWDYSNAQLMPLDRMERQCELGLKWLKAGEIDGMIFLGSGVLDKNLRSVEWTRQWIAKVGLEELE